MKDWNIREFINIIHDTIGWRRVERTELLLMSHYSLVNEDKNS